MNRKWVGLLAIFLFVAGLIVVGAIYWKHAQIYPSTEDAYVGGDIYPVSSKIPGTILTLDVVDNQVVKKGQVIATLDPRDYDVAVDKASAGLAKARAMLAMDTARIEQAEAQLKAAESQLALARIELKRASSLYESKSIPKRQYDKAVTAYKVALAQYKVARKAITMAKARLAVSKREVRVSEAKLAKSKLERSYCTIVAPVDGVISKKSADVGQVIAPGQPICAVVPLKGEHIWVDANFKETQLRRIRPGQPVRFYTDVDPRRIYRGYVDSLSAGTGAAFSLLPPENAAGNWVKIVQRLPVRIAIDPRTNADHSLRLGLSVHVTVDTTGKSYKISSNK